MVHHDTELLRARRASTTSAVIPDLSGDAASSAGVLDIVVNLGSHVAITGAMTVLFASGAGGTARAWSTPGYVDHPKTLVTKVSAEPDQRAVARKAAEGERKWFLENKVSLMQDFRNRYVAVYAQRVVAQHKDVNELMHRFFTKHGTVGVHFGYVGDEPGAQLPVG